jgi:hypothetical protein
MAFGYLNFDFWYLFGIWNLVLGILSQSYFRPGGLV